MTTMHERIKEQCDLAVTYAQDGAYASAARVLRDIAMETGHHANRVATLVHAEPGHAGFARRPD